MTLQNLVDYCQDFNQEDIFSGVIVPEPLNPEDVKSAIMIRCGLLTPIYSEPSTMRSMLKFWFSSHIWNIEHLIKIILAEYSPIENYDRYEDITINRKNKETNSGSDGTNGSSTDTLTGSDTFTHGETIESQVSAFNTSSYSNNDKEIHNGDDVTQYGKTDTLSSSNTTTYGKITDNVGDEHTISHIHGNIGIKTSEQVINEELELLKNFNVYDWIASQVENDLFLTIY